MEVVLNNQMSEVVERKNGIHKPSLMTGFVSYKYKSVIPGIIVHGVNNFCSVLITIIL